jgi:hypothetical protein
VAAAAGHQAIIPVNVMISLIDPGSFEPRLDEISSSCDNLTRCKRTEREKDHH